MKILVTGNAGFIGSHIADRLIKECHEVYGIDDLSGGFVENINSMCHFSKEDLKNSERIKNVVNEIKPDILFHLAADAAEGRSQFTPVSATSNNLTAYINVLAPCINNGLKKVIMFSSMSVYGASQVPFSEEMIPMPKDVYGVNKFAMEEVTKILADVHGFKWTIIRPHNVIGERQNLSDPYRNVLTIWINSLMRNKPFYIYGDGEQKRAFSYIDEIAESCIKTTNLANGEILNMGSIEYVTLNELARLVLAEYGSDLKPIYVLDRPKEVKDAYCTNDKAEKLLGYVQRNDLKMAVKKIIRWAKSVGPKEPRYIDSMDINTDKIPITWKNKLI